MICAGVWDTAFDHPGLFFLLLDVCGTNPQNSAGEASVEPWKEHGCGDETDYGSNRAWLVLHCRLPSLSLLFVL